MSGVDGGGVAGAGAGAPGGAGAGAGAGARGVYETDELLNQYLLFHFGGAEETLPYADGPAGALGFPRRCVGEGFDFSGLPADPAGRRALDLGCAVGGASFALARHCAEVVGIDYSARFIGAAQELQRAGRLDYWIAEVGARGRGATAVVPGDVDRSGVRFQTGDAHDLPPDLGEFDAVIAANLLCRMADPRRLLARLPSLVRPGGQLVLTTPNTWLEAFTPRRNWLGATPETGEPLDAIASELRPAFELRKVADLPFLIREHARKFQWSVAQLSSWVRVGD